MPPYKKILYPYLTCATGTFFTKMYYDCKKCLSSERSMDKNFYSGKCKFNREVDAVQGQFRRNAGKYIWEGMIFPYGWGCYTFANIVVQMNPPKDISSKGQ